MRADDIRRDNQVRTGNRAVKVRLACEMHHGVDPLHPQQRFGAGSISDATLHEAQRRLTPHAAQAHQIARVRKIVEHHNPVRRRVEDPVLNEVRA